MSLMENKFLRFLLNEPQARSKLALLMVCFVATVVDLKILNGQERRLGKVRAEKNLVDSVPAMTRKLGGYTVRTSESTQLAKVEFVYRGTILKDGMSYALIDDIFYTQGDSIGDYAVVKIDASETILKNKFTHEIRKLYFHPIE